MNYFLVLSEINKYFQGVSSLDTKVMASAYACDNQCYDSILQILSEEIIPDYYENIFRNDSKFGRNEIEYEAEQRRYHYDVIEKTNGEDGNEDCEINITIAGESFVVQTDKWKNFFLDVVLGNSYHITAPKIYIDDMFNMFEELVQVKYALRGLISIYLSCIGSNVDSGEFRNALCFKLFTGGITFYDSHEDDGPYGGRSHLFQMQGMRRSFHPFRGPLLRHPFPDHGIAPLPEVLHKKNPLRRNGVDLQVD